jgi:NAD(P)-dependent dehydrogenase (short-subunit alcohol dehydrogenase family)
MTTFPDHRLDGKTAIVTGASSGIGAAIAEAMAQAGASVVLVGRDAGRLERVAGLCGERSAVVVADVIAADAPALIVQRALDAFGGIDVIVHSAGVFAPKPFPDSPVESLDAQWLVNVRAPYAITHAAQEHLGEGSAVIFISSIAGQVGFMGAAAYCATKGAVEQLTKSLAVELAPRGIRVNAIAPGNIHSPMNEQYFQSAEYEAAMIERTPAGRVGVVEDIAPVAVFLASDAARYIHGASLLVDGGWAAQ